MGFAASALVRLTGLAILVGPALAQQRPQPPAKVFDAGMRSTYSVRKDDTSMPQRRLEIRNTTAAMAMVYNGLRPEAGHPGVLDFRIYGDRELSSRQVKRCLPPDAAGAPLTFDCLQLSIARSSNETSPTPIRGHVVLWQPAAANTAAAGWQPLAVQLVGEETTSAIESGKAIPLTQDAVVPQGGSPAAQAWQDLTRALYAAQPDPAQKMLLLFKQTNAARGRMEHTLLASAKPAQDAVFVPFQANLFWYWNSFTVHAREPDGGRIVVPMESSINEGSEPQTVQKTFPIPTGGTFAVKAQFGAKQFPHDDDADPKTHFSGVERAIKSLDIQNMSEQPQQVEIYAYVINNKKAGRMDAQGSKVRKIMLHTGTLNPGRNQIDVRAAVPQNPVQWWQNQYQVNAISFVVKIDGVSTVIATANQGSSSGPKGGSWPF